MVGTFILYPRWFQFRFSGSNEQTIPLRVMTIPGKAKKAFPFRRMPFQSQFANQLGFATTKSQNHSTNAQEGQGGRFGYLFVQHVTEAEARGCVCAVGVNCIRGVRR
jgi:hypothetical protein